jgi:hypothetical protein
MQIQFESISDKAMLLPSNLKLVLAERLLESIDSSIDKRIENLWIEEIRIRSNEIDTGLVDCVPSEKVISELRKNFAGIN